VLFILPLSHADDGAPKVGTLKTRDFIVTVSSSYKGPLYSISTNQGQRLAQEITADELISTYPELAELFKYGLADDASLLHSKYGNLPISNDLQIIQDY